MCESSNCPRLSSSGLYFRKHMDGAASPFIRLALASPDPTEGPVCAALGSLSTNQHQSYPLSPTPDMDPPGCTTPSDGAQLPPLLPQRESALTRIW